MHVVITGGTGMIGRALTKRLRNSPKQHTVTVVSRTPGERRWTWKEIETKGISEKVDAFIALSGAPIMDKPWTKERKKEIFESRVHTTHSLVRAIRQSNFKPKVFIQGSAIGIYPDSETATYDEYYKGPWATDFGGELVKAWEESSKDLEDLGIRRVIVRTSLVLHTPSEGGALGRMILPFGFVAGKIGSGQQFFPWISMDDICGIFEFALENEHVSGVLNGVAPEVVTNAQFAEALSKATGKIAIPTPAFVAKLMFGERASLVTEGKKVIPKRVLELGYQFQHPTLTETLDTIFSKR